MFFIEYGLWFYTGFYYAWHKGVHLGISTLESLEQTFKAAFWVIETEVMARKLNYAVPNLTKRFVGTFHLWTGSL
jgi:hypothetical protein